MFPDAAIDYIINHQETSVTDQHQPEIEEDDEFPPVHFSLRNQGGNAQNLELHQPLLGLDLYILIQPGDDAIDLTASHLDFDSLAGALAVVLATALQAEEISDETREQVLALINDAAEEEA